MGEELDYHTLFQSFYSSELNAHSRLLIGFAVLLFTLTNIGWNPSSNSTLMQLQYGLLWLSMLLTSFAFWFILMRQLVYGVLSNRLMHIQKLESIEQVHREVGQYCSREEKILLRIPVSWFYSANEEGRKRHVRIRGFLLCAVLAFGTTTVLILIQNLIP